MASNPRLGKYREELRAYVEKYHSWKAMKRDFVFAYMRVFSKAEVDAMIDFVKSPAGQKAMAAMPMLMRAKRDCNKIFMNYL